MAALCLLLSSDLISKTQAAHPVSWTDAWVTVDDYVDVKLNIFLDDVLRHAGVPVPDTGLVAAEDVQRALAQHQEKLNRLLKIFDDKGIRLTDPVVTPPHWQPRGDLINLHADASLKVSWKLSYALHQESSAYTFLHGFSSDDLTQPGELRLHLKHRPTGRRIDAVIPPYRPHKVLMPSAASATQPEPNGVTIRCTVAPQRFMVEITQPLLMTDNLFPQAEQYRTGVNQMPDQLTPSVAGQILSAAESWVQEIEFTSGGISVELLETHAEWLIGSETFGGMLKSGESIPVFGTSIGVRGLFAKHQLTESSLLLVSNLPKQVTELTLELVTPEGQSSEIVAVNHTTDTGPTAIGLKGLTRPSVASVASPVFSPVMLRPVTGTPQTIRWAAIVAGVCCIPVVFASVSRARKLASCTAIGGIGLAAGLLLPSEQPDLNSAQLESLVAHRIDSVVRIVSDPWETDISGRLEPHLTDDVAEDVYLSLQTSLSTSADSPLLVSIEQVALDSVSVRQFDQQQVSARITWQVSGMVSHWGHTHRRTQQVSADCRVEKEGGAWRIRALKPISQEILIEEDPA